MTPHFQHPHRLEPTLDTALEKAGKDQQTNVSDQSESLLTHPDADGFHYSTVIAMYPDDETGELVLRETLVPRILRHHVLSNGTLWIDYCGLSSSQLIADVPCLIPAQAEESPL
jgi:hypothetical protein